MEVGLDFNHPSMMVVRSTAPQSPGRDYNRGGTAVLDCSGPLLWSSIACDWSREEVSGYLSGCQVVLQVLVERAVVRAREVREEDGVGDNGCSGTTPAHWLGHCTCKCGGD